MLGRLIRDTRLVRYETGEFERTDSFFENMIDASGPLGALHVAFGKEKWDGLGGKAFRHSLCSSAGEACGSKEVEPLGGAKEDGGWGKIKESRAFYVAHKVHSRGLKIEAKEAKNGKEATQERDLTATLFVNWRIIVNLKVRQPSFLRMQPLRVPPLTRSTLTLSADGPRHQGEFYSG